MNDEHWHPSGNANFETVRNSPAKTEDSILTHILSQGKSDGKKQHLIIMCDYTQVSPGEDILPLKLAVLADI